jgi:hypothetical protein
MDNSPWSKPTRRQIGAAGGPFRHLIRFNIRQCIISERTNSNNRDVEIKRVKINDGVSWMIGSFDAPSVLQHQWENNRFDGPDGQQESRALWNIIEAWSVGRPRCALWRLKPCRRGPQSPRGWSNILSCLFKILHNVLKVSMPCTGD